MVNKETSAISIEDRIIDKFDDFETRLKQLQEKIDESNEKLRLIADSLGLKDDWMRIPLHEK